jgi:hypothetical protein
MSEYSPGTFQFAERIMDMSVHDAHRQVQADRLGRRARVGHERRHRFYSGALASLGCRLTTWGEILQERHGTDGTASVSQSAGV